MNDYQQLTQLVTPACESFGVEELSIFGSRARGDANADSDFDFLVTFDRSQTGRLSDRFFGLLFYLEDNISRHVDLLEQNAIRNPYLHEAIEEERKIIYGERTENAGYTPERH